MKKGDHVRLEHLEYIIAIEKYGSMNIAAQHLHVSQQNISKVLKQLEQELGIAIFERTKKGTILTEEGKLVYQFAQKQWQVYQKMKETLYQSYLQGTLSIWSMNSGSSMIIPQMLCTFYKNYPQVDLQIHDCLLQEVFHAICSQEADLGIISYIQIKDCLYPAIPDGLQMVPLLKAKSYYWVKADSVYAQKGFITLRECNKESVLVYESVDLALLTQIFHAHHLEPRIGTKSKNLHLLSQLVINGQGVLPDMLFFNDEMLFSYAFQNREQALAVPLQAEIEHSGVAYVIDRERKKSKLLIHALQFLQKNVVQESR